ncbi:MAG: sensor histidine kinase [Rhodothermales bacterium]|nr:sensor histidine kinase [Rhodothermales bacterium]
MRTLTAWIRGLAVGLALLAAQPAATQPTLALPDSARPDPGQVGFRDSLRYHNPTPGKWVFIWVEHLGNGQARIVRRVGDAPPDTFPTTTTELALLPDIANTDSIVVTRFAVGVKHGRVFFGVEQAWPQVLAGTFLLLLVVGGGVVLRRSQRRVKVAEAQVAQQFQTALHVEKGHEAERGRLARDLHDGPLQDLAAVRMRLYSAQNLPPEVVETLDEALGHIAQVLRGLTDDLRTPLLHEAGLATAVETMAQRRHPELILDLGFDDAVTPPDPLGATCFRIVQEALANAVRHGDASNAHVTLDRVNGRWDLAVNDDGGGFDLGGDAPDFAALESESHFGLVGMRERVRLLGGTLEVTSTPGQGTTVRATLPANTA